MKYSIFEFLFENCPPNIKLVSLSEKMQLPFLGWIYLFS